LQSVPILKLCSVSRFDILNTECREITFKAGAKIYEVGGANYNIYLVREGIVSLDTSIEINKYERYPIAHDEWEIRKEIKHIIYKLKCIKRGKFFGQEEVIMDLPFRRISATAITNVKII
jgi:CRP-like cAMP-binding protein